MISKEALAEFKKIYFDESGVTLTEEEALESALNLLALANAIYRPVKKRWLDSS